MTPSYAYAAQETLWTRNPQRRLRAGATLDRTD
jgi:hypothetical protein